MSHNGRVLISMQENWYEMCRKLQAVGLLILKIVRQPFQNQ
jgi:hypothetical protein